MIRDWAPSFKRAQSASDAICRICAAVRAAGDLQQLGPVVALSVAAEAELEDTAASLQKEVVSSLLRLHEDEALDLLRQLPPEASFAADHGEDCPLAGNCRYRALLQHYLAPSCDIC